MKRYRIVQWLIASVVALQCMVVASSTSTVNAFTKENLVFGSTGYNVYELQNRLKFLGYYHHKVDGVFGWSTYWGVRDFQYAFGMKPSGIVKLPTKSKLVRATQNWHYQGPTSQPQHHSTPSSGSSSNAANSGAAAAAVSSAPVQGISSADQTLLAHVVYAEARGEPFPGQVAVAAVVLNRLHDPKFPHSIPAIIYQPQAFTSVQDGQLNLQPDSQAVRAVQEAVHGVDPSYGATYYFNPATATSRWIWSKPEILRIGKHIFCRS